MAFKTNTQYVVDGFGADGLPIFREATNSEKYHRKHLEMVFAPILSSGESAHLEAKANLLSKNKEQIAKALRVPEALLK